MSKKILRSVLALLPENGIDDLEEFRQKHIHHPGKDVPFHVTLLSNFLLPDEINDEIENKIKGIAMNTNRFAFFAKPLSAFPTNRVLYLNPSPITPIEELVVKLYDEFPNFGNSKQGFHTYHMTIALAYDLKKQQKIIDEYIDKFSYQPLKLQAGSLAIFCECESGEWKVYKKFRLGIENE